MSNHSWASSWVEKSPQSFELPGFGGTAIVVAVVEPEPGGADGVTVGVDASDGVPGEPKTGVSMTRGSRTGNPRTGVSMFITESVHSPTNNPRRKSASFRSTDNPHLALRPTHPATYGHLKSLLVGIHSAGSSAPLDLLERTVTVTKAPSSLAKASRLSPSHPKAPESHASANGTR